MGISDGLVRVSVGIENTEDLIADFSQAVGAGGRVRRDPRLGARALRSGNDEPLADFAAKRPAFHRIDAGQRRRLGGDGGLEGIERVARGVDQHTSGVVQHFAPNPQSPGQLPDKGPETDPLNLPAHPDRPALHQCTVQIIQGSKDRTIC